MMETPGDMSGLMIESVFSLADTPVKSTIEEKDNTLEGSQTPTSLNVIRQTNEQDFEHLLNSSPVPIKKCSVRVDNFIEKDVRNKITEACNNAIVKQEPDEATMNEQSAQSDSVETNGGDPDEQPRGRPARKRKPNSLMSSEFLYKNKDIVEFQKSKNRKKSKQEVTCQIDHDLVMTVAEKCLPEVVEKTEQKEDIKMVSILPPTLQVNINDTPVVIDWQGKVRRPQTARTKKKLRTQEQIDKENEETLKKKKKLKPKSKSKKKTSKTDPSPPHLEPYGGEFLDNVPPTDTPGSPGELPPQLKPYEVGVNNESEKKRSKFSSRAAAMPLLAEVLQTGKPRVENEDQNRIPCSLTGRMRKPNQQYENYVIGDSVKGARPTPKPKPSSDPKVVKAVQEQNTTINHENNTVFVTMLPNNGKHTDISSKTMPNIYNSASQYMDSQVSSALTLPGNAATSLLSRTPTTTQATGTASNPKISNAIGELAKIENTKKFFQLVVGDKIVLIPTDGNNVVPKAFVMDLAASKPGSSIAQSAKAKLPSTEPSAQKTFFMNIGGKPSTQTVQGEGIRNVQLNQNQSAIPQNLRVNQSTIPQKIQLNQSAIAHNLQLNQSAIAQNLQLNQSATAQNIQIVPSTSQTINKVVIQSNMKSMLPTQQTTTTTHHPNILQRPIVSPQRMKYSVTGGTRPGAKVILPIVSNVVEHKTAPYPTHIITNSSSVTATFSPTPVISSLQTNTQGNLNSQNTVKSTTVSSTSSQLSSSSWSNVAPSIGTKVKEEPNNIKDYEKAVEAFKGVPDNDSETESDDESKKAQHKGPEVPEVGSHVPASESATAEKIRKLKEKLRQQQMEVDNLRKSRPSKDEENEVSS